MKFKNLTISKETVIKGDYLKTVLELERMLDSANMKKVISKMQEVGKPMIVSHIKQLCGFDQAYTSQRLAMLRKFRLVSREKSGREMYYSVNDFELHLASNFLKLLPKGAIESLCHEDQFFILENLIQECELTVTDIFLKCRLTRAAAQRHLKSLKDSGLVYFEVRGVFHLYYPRIEALTDIAGKLEAFFINQPQPV